MAKKKVPGGHMVGIIQEEKSKQEKDTSAPNPKAGQGK